MADDLEVLKPKGSCLGKLTVLFAFAGVAALGVALFFITQAQDLSDIAGRKPAAGEEKARDLRAVLKSAVEDSYPVTLTEEEVNRYLRQTLAARQGGLLEKAAALEGVRVRLEKDRAEIITERTVAGWPVTLSMYVRVEQTIDVKGKIRTSVAREGGPYLPEVPRLEHLLKGGRFGQLVVPQGFLLLVLPGFEKLATVYKDEIHYGFEEMARITLEEGKLVLDPRPEGDAGLPGEF
jgi:hypothetical protein